MTGHGTITVAGVQFAAAAADKPANADSAERLIRQAARYGAQVVVTPECVLTGFVGGPQEQALAEPIPGPSTDRFGDLARELGVTILLGLSECRNDSVYDAMAVLSPAGRVEGIMRKVHIDRYQAAAGWRNGSAFPVFDLNTRTGDGRFGILVCYDAEPPEAARLLAVQNADVIFNPLASRCPTSDMHRCLLRTRAFENEVYVLAVNHAAPGQNGHSMVIDFDGTILAELDEGEGVLVHDLDLDRLRQRRAAGVHGLHHRRPELYGQLIDPAGQLHTLEANLPPDSSARAYDV